MTRPMHRQDGFTLVELLLASTLALIVFGATLTAWTSVYGSNRAAEKQQDNTESARIAIDRAGRQLRNLANQTQTGVNTIDNASGYDFIFQTSDPSKTWVRYCSQTSGGSASVNDATLWVHESKSTLAAVNSGMRSGCPSTAPEWAKTQAVVQHVTNQAGGVDRPIFRFECAVAAPAGCPASATDYPKIVNVGLNLWVDADRTDRVSELNVTSSVFLRNQNESPTAVASASRYATRQILLNGSGSSDPEGRTLEYFWFEDSPPSASEIAGTGCSATYPSAKWEGLTYLRRYDSSQATGVEKTFYLLVRDPGCLTSVSSPIKYQVPS
jgi:prepilin-type N-terminal cleavage/methylation domain-containing protein